MWSSIVLLKCEVVGLSMDERNDIRLNNFIPIAYTGQISGDKPSAKSASDVSGNGFGIDLHLEQYPTSIFQQLS
jgi:hypothetical protein